MKFYNKVFKTNLIILVLIASLALTFLMPPLLTNYLFSINAPFKLLVATWTSGEQLMFFASMTSSVIAIVGVLLTIKKGQDNLEKQHRESVLPYFVIETLEKKYRDILKDAFNSYDGANLSSVSSDKYEEFKLKEVFIEINKNDVEYKTEIDKNLRQTIEFGNKSIVNIGSVKHIVQGDTISIPFQLVNYGNGNSVNVRVGLNKSEILNDNRKYLHPFSLLKNEKLYFHIVSKAANEIDDRNYDFEIIYHDIYGNAYQQIFKLGITIQKNNSYTFDPNSVQGKISLPN